MKTSEKELKLKIKRAYEAATPDVLASVLSCCEKEKGRVIPMEKKSRSKKKRFIGFAAAAAALLLVLAGAVGVLAGNARKNGEVFATVSLDVNPSIEIAVNKQEKVISVKALNDDAARIVNNMELVGSSIDVAVNALIGSMLRNGYLSDIANSILITVDNADAQLAQQLQRKLADEIEAALAASGGGAVISQTADTREDMESIANRYGITKGKAQLIYSIIAAAPKFTFEQLAGLTINELNLLYSKYGSANPADNRINEGKPSENAYIDRERAIEIALEHAGVSAGEVSSGIDCELDFDHGTMVYEIEFVAKGMEYGFDIDARTGAVVDFEIEPADNGANPIAPSPSNGPESYIGEAAAKRIAFDRASVGESEVSGCIVKLEHDHGRMVYDVEFKAKGYEYDVDVDAVSGEIIEFDMDPIGHQPNPSNAPSATPTPQPSYIGEEAAKRIAFERAQVAAENVYALSVRLEHDHGRPVYDVEFRANGFKYDVDVDAVNGSVLEFDMDPIATPVPNPTNAPRPSGAPSVTPVPAPTPTSAPGYIGEENAKSIAFSRAGISASEATQVRVELKRENGRMIYDVEFKARGFEYDVDIDAITGAVLEFDMDEDDDAPRPTSAPSNPTPQPTSAPNYIGAETAKRIAFNRAGVNASEATQVKVELERENGRMIYDVEFEARGYEYEVKVDAITGNVLYFNSEYDGAHTRPTASPRPTNAPAPSPEPGMIGTEAAKRIAFERAGISAGEATGVKVELDRENGRFIYEVEFKARGNEYDVKVDAYTGSVVGYECEPDDDAQPQPTNPPAGGDLISEAQAKAIAFQRAGVTQAQVTWIEIELDRDDGVMIYEIEFRANGREYSAEINAVTGAVIDFDAD